VEVPWKGKSPTGEGVTEKGKRKLIERRKYYGRWVEYVVEEENKLR